ncbi:MAG TPA: hypothetical protein VGU74_15980, partial [Gemmatimonadales bacterium]|nr:hypothetical protein [Gemmatimonadales bacterium]
TLRMFTRFYSSPVPKHSAFHRAHNRLTPKMIERINELLIQGAIHDGIENGVMLRSDTMVVETNIHWPTDGTLLWDTVRVLTRLVLRQNLIRLDESRFSRDDSLATDQGTPGESIESQARGSVAGGGRRLGSSGPSGKDAEQRVGRRAT